MRDWIGSPREWGEWGMRATAWFNELVDTVTGLEVGHTGFSYRVPGPTFDNSTTTAAVSDMTTVASLVNGRDYKVSWGVHLVASVAGDTARCRVVGPSSTPIYNSWDFQLSGGAATFVTGSFVFTAGATADTTFIMQHFRIVGTGTIRGYADATRQPYFTVEPFS